MRPVSTEYYLADESTYPLLHDLLTATDADDVPFGFPTVYAVRQGILLGFLGTLESPEAVVAGPLCLDPTLKAPMVTALRLTEVYEQVLKQAGCTSYLFGVDLSNLPWRAVLAKRGYLPYATDATSEWFKKEID